MRSLNSVLPLLMRKWIKNFKYINLLKIGIVRSLKLEEEKGKR